MYYICTPYSYKELSIFMLTEPNCSFVLIFKKLKYLATFYSLKKNGFFIYVFVKCLIPSLFSSRP